MKEETKKIFRTVTRKGQVISSKQTKANNECPQKIKVELIVIDDISGI